MLFLQTKFVKKILMHNSQNINTKEKLKIHFIALQANKNTKDFQIVYQLTSVQLFGVILRILRNKEQAEDCLQEVYLKVWHKIDSYQVDKSNPTTWMSTIAKNHAIDYIRKHKIMIDNSILIENIDDMTPSFLNRLEQNVDDQLLHYCLKKLKPEVMEVFLLSYFNGLTYQNIASRLKAPLSTIKTWVRRSLPILKHCIETKR